MSSRRRRGMSAERAPRALKPPALSIQLPENGSASGLRESAAMVVFLGRFPCGMRYQNVAWRATEHAYLQALRETGATGLEAATSGVTGRAWSFGVERGSAGISDKSRPFAHLRCGDYRVSARPSEDLPRDMRGMKRCLRWRRTDAKRGSRLPPYHPGREPDARAQPGLRTRAPQTERI